MSEFIPFPKIPRLKRGCVITEKLDGTNAQIVIGEDGSIRAGSRNRWISPEDDNYGFAKWVKANEDDLSSLGPGQHFGEWWGNGIQRGYGLSEKRFSLFNSGRWTGNEALPACCSVVPVLYQGDFTTTTVDWVLDSLREAGSVAAPGFMKPEGVIVFMTASRHLYKVLAENDDKAKGEAA